MKITINKFENARIATSEEIKAITSWPSHLIGDEHPSVDDGWTTEYFILKVNSKFLSEMGEMFRNMGYESEETELIHIFKENQDLVLMPFEPLTVLVSLWVLREAPNYFTRSYITELGYDYDSLSVNGNDITVNLDTDGNFILAYDLISILM